MKRKLMPFLCFVPVLAIAMEAVFSQVSAAVSGQGLVVRFTVTGVPANTSSQQFQATADASATWVCVNRGSNVPRAANKRASVTAEVSGSASFKGSPNISGSVLVRAPMADLQCPSGQTKRLASVSFSDVRISSPTLNISQQVSGVFKKTLIALK